jgi:cell pole-organizing protein PopZ
MRHEGEPSVEEILESIKKVIARDNREAQQAERRQRESAGVAFDPADEDDSGEVLDLGEELIQGEPTREPAPRSEDGLTTESAARSMRDSLAALAMISEPSMPPQIVRSGETSLEGLVRDMLRPMLAEWLDRNLPEMVERLVKAEIARIAGKKG